MGLWSSVGAFFSGAVSTISRAVSGIGSALSSFATGVGAVIGNIVSALAPVASAVGKFANAFLQGLGFLKPDESAEELGERALQAAEQGINIDQFDDFDDYMAKLRDFKLDPDVSARRSIADKLVAGLGVGTVGVEDKFNVERGSLNGMWLLPMTNPGYFTPERMRDMVSTGRLGGDVFSYLENKLSGAEARSFEKSLEINPDGTPMDPKGQDNLYEALDNARESWANIAKQMEERNQKG